MSFTAMHPSKVRLAPSTPLFACRVALTPSSSVRKLPARKRSGSVVPNALLSRAPAAPGSLPPKEERPGVLDALNFQESENVAFWGNLQPATASTFSERLSAESAELRSEIGRAEDLAYWTYHLFRSGALAVQAAAGLAATEAADRLTKIQEDGQVQLLEALSGKKMGGLTTDTGARLLFESIVTYRQDFKNIQEGLYLAPYDMEPGHRQYNPLFVLDQSRRFLGEAVAVLGRRNAQSSTDVWIANSKLYPKYYQHTFHYQTDGWLSSDSAKVYELSTETLFLGRQDAMQRHSLVPFARFMQGRDEADTHVLEIACGTGRFHTFLRDNYPALQTVASDLSPYYLEEARLNMNYWEGFRGPSIANKGTTTFVQANAEELPFPDDSQDAVLCVYLFHELPAPARRNVFKEVCRVLKPGGMFVMTDSIQLGDRPIQDPTIGNFENFAEPHYRGYIATDLGALGRECGLHPFSKELVSSSKTLSFMKVAEAKEDAFLEEEVSLGESAP